jgi:hypothetical protein
VVVILHTQISLNLPSGIRRVGRYQRGNKNPYIEEEQTTQWPKISTKGQTTIYKAYT